MAHFQLLAAIIACMPSLSGGLTYGFSAILIPQLQDPESDIQITLEQGSWIGESLPSFHREIIKYGRINCDKPCNRADNTDNSVAQYNTATI